MQNTNKNPQAVGSTKWIGLANTSYCNYFDPQRKPTHLPNPNHYFKHDPILLAVDKASLWFIRRLQGVCLFYAEVAGYDFSFCFEREVWVLYSQKAKFDAAMQLARTIQLAGASKALVMLLKAELVRRNTYDFR